MNTWIKEIEPKIKKLYEQEIGNSDDLIYFEMTENLECEIQKADGARTRIQRRIIDTYESDFASRQILIRKLKDFKIPKSI
jgi:hypothetical protein